MIMGMKLSKIAGFTFLFQVQIKHMHPQTQYALYMTVFPGVEYRTCLHLSLPTLQSNSSVTLSAKV